MPSPLRWASLSARRSGSATVWTLVCRSGWTWVTGRRNRVADSVATPSRWLHHGRGRAAVVRWNSRPAHPAPPATIVNGRVPTRPRLPQWREDWLIAMHHRCCSSRCRFCRDAMGELCRGSWGNYSGKPTSWRPGRGIGLAVKSCPAGNRLVRWHRPKSSRPMIAARGAGCKWRPIHICTLSSRVAAGRIVLPG